jgi:hypothetical protein
VRFSAVFSRGRIVRSSSAFLAGDPNEVSR